MNSPAHSAQPDSSTADFQAFVSQRLGHFEQVLEACLPSAETQPTRLHAAMRYSTLNGGKRIRPLLTYATGALFDAPKELLDPVACAVELIHAYSLIHDDLPAMDDDNLRRGKPTCHIAFDDATAILAGDALQALAFDVLLNGDNPISVSDKLTSAQCLSKACGSGGMVGGQALDLSVEGSKIPVEELEIIHKMKTGALIHASVMMAVYATGCHEPHHIESLSHFAKSIGLAFQVVDDILDIESTTETLGKTQGADQARNKPTYPELLGLEEAKTKAKVLYEHALDALEQFGEKANALRSLSSWIVARNF